MKTFGLFVFVLLLICSLRVSAHADGYQSKLDLFKDAHYDSSSNSINSEISLVVTPDTLSKNADWVTVKFSNVPEPNDGDIIAVYTPSNVSITETAPVKYQYANYSEDYENLGYGSLKFRIINMYADYVFIFYRNGTERPVYATRSNTVDFVNHQAPLQVHLSLTSIPSQMRVSWGSGTATEQFIKYGLISSNYTNELQSTTYTYSNKEMCGSPAVDFGWRVPGNLQTVVIDFTHQQLKDSVRVYYVVGSDVSGWSDEYSFKLKGVGPKHNVKVVAYGDMGKGEPDNSFEYNNWEEWPAANTTLNTFHRITDDDYDIVYHVGDIAYSVGYSAQWDEFMDLIQPVSSLVPYMTLPGNHERDFHGSGSMMNGSDSGGECGIPYEKRFIMPNATHSIPWHSFNYGNIHFVSISTEVNFTIGSQQYLWLIDDLSSVDRSVTPWVIVGGHRPFYVDSSPAEDSAWDIMWSNIIREQLEDVLVKYQVDLTITGHWHNYQRTCPVYKDECYEDSKPIHVIAGMAGCSLNTNFKNETPIWIETINDVDYGYTTIETTEKHLTFRFFSEANIKKDEFVIHK